MPMSICSAFIQQAERQPEALFIETETARYSYGEIYERSRRLAHYLRVEQGVQAGDRIVLCFPNEVEYLLAYIACWWLGVTGVPIDVDSRMSTIDTIISDASPALVLHSVRKEMTGLTMDPQKAIAFPIDDRYAKYDPIATSAPEGHSCALIMYTSGTTGSPKGVMLSHYNLRFTAERIIEWAELESTAKEATILRLSHSFGLGHVHCCILLGASIMLMDSVRDSKRMLSLIKERSVTGIPATPALVQYLLTYHRDDFRESCAGLDYLVINTSPIEARYVEELLQLLPHTRIYMYYGLTEASRSTYIAYRLHTDKLASVGKPPNGVQIRVSQGTGEIQISGSNVMLGYLGYPRGASFTDDGWFPTGDTGYIDKDGFLYVTGRLKDQINIDGLKVSPLEVERVLNSHPGVKESIVFGIPDSLTFESVAAAIVIQEGEDGPLVLSELKRWCKPHLELYKIPKKIRAWSSIPKTDSGKPRRMEARAIWASQQEI